MNEKTFNFCWITVFAEADPPLLETEPFVVVQIAEMPNLFGARFPASVSFHLQAKLLEFALTQDIVSVGGKMAKLKGMLS